MAAGQVGSATITAIRQTGTMVNYNPECDLDLQVAVNGSAPYPVTHRRSSRRSPWRASSRARRCRPPSIRMAPIADRRLAGRYNSRRSRGTGYSASAVSRMPGCVPRARACLACAQLCTDRRSRGGRPGRHRLLGRRYAGHRRQRGPAQPRDAVPAQRAASAATLPALVESARLDQYRDRLLAGHGRRAVFDHKSPEGRTVVDRLTAVGYLPGSGQWRPGEHRLGPGMAGHAALDHERVDEQRGPPREHPLEQLLRHRARRRDGDADRVGARGGDVTNDFGRHVADTTVVHAPDAHQAPWST